MWRQPKQNLLTQLWMKLRNSMILNKPDATGYFSTGYQNEPGWMVEVRVSPNAEASLAVAGKRQNMSRHNIVDGVIHAHFETLDTEIHNAFDDYRNTCVFVTAYEEPVEIGIVTIVHNETFELFLLDRIELTKVQNAVDNGQEHVNLGWVSFDFHKEQSLYVDGLSGYNPQYN